MICDLFPTPSFWLVAEVGNSFAGAVGLDGLLCPVGQCPDFVLVALPQWVPHYTQGHLAAGFRQLPTCHGFVASQTRYPLSLMHFGHLGFEDRALMPSQTGP